MKDFDKEAEERLSRILVAGRKAYVSGPMAIEFEKDFQFLCKALRALLQENHELTLALTVALRRAKN